MRNIVCVIAYDGSKFCGFSSHGFGAQGFDPYSFSPRLDSIKSSRGQTHDCSVGDFFMFVLKKIGVNSKIIAAGRTDRGVHATGQVINFFTDSKMDLEKMKKLLNVRLYPHILIRKIFLASSDFHARFSAKSRTYRYVFTICGKKDVLPFFTDYIAIVRCGSVDSIQNALECFVGVHDFSLFKKLGSDTKSNIREIYSAKIFSKNVFKIPSLIIQIKANGFLRSQVRLMLKACFDFSLNKISLENLKNQIDNKLSLNDRICVRELAPACGLYLCKVEY